MFIGDDLGDLPAFAALARPARGGHPRGRRRQRFPEVTGLREQADLLLPGPTAWWISCMRSPNAPLRDADG